MATLLTVHAHPDDESIGMGGTIAKAVRDGHRVVLVTATRGELGEIVVPEMDTPDNHRRLGELRAVELETAMVHLGVTEWENLGYRDSDMMGRVGNRDARCFWQADLDEAAGRLTWLIRQVRPDVVTMYNSFGGYGHPDHIRVHDVTIRAFERAGDPSWYPGQLGGEGGLEIWRPKKLYEQAIPTSVRKAMDEAIQATTGQPSRWAEPEEATEEEKAAFREQMAKMLVPDETITTWVDISTTIEQKWHAVRAHVTQFADTFPWIQLGLDGWRRIWTKEAYILRESSVPTSPPESDLFAGF
ncbi:MAG TPA: PIG-L family deacetylase [Candidatus Polarisedimenticolia bacterium]|nr:PIG-L family deacetylase [Candidatus Polarisedimenticolia bacterium]